MTRELTRKILHVLLSGVPLMYFVLPGVWGLLGLIIATSLVVIVDLIRLRNRRLKAWFLRHFRRLFRHGERERGHLLGSTYYVLAACACVLLFDSRIAAAALAFLVVGDTAAALVGRRFGTPRLWGKSWQGSVGCFGVCLALGAALFADWPVVLAGAATATIAEAAPVPVDDNFRIPLLSGLVMQFVMSYL